MSSVETQMGLPERRYLLPGIVVFGGALIAYFVGVLPAQGEASDGAADLEQQHAGLTAALAAPGGPPTKGTLDAATQARERLAAEHDKCVQLYRAADSALEWYFPDYKGARDLPNTQSFKQVYAEACRSLAARAEAVAARDANGQRLAPFEFRDWGGAPPGELEVQPAQKEYLIQKAMLLAVEGLTGARLRGVRVATVPDEVNAALAGTLPALDVTPSKGDPWTRWQWIEATVEVECRGAQVGALLTSLLGLGTGEPEKRLLSELRAVQVQASGTSKLEEQVTVAYDPKKGQTPETMVDIDAMEPPVSVRVTLAVLDPPTVGRAP